MGCKVLFMDLLHHQKSGFLILRDTDHIIVTMPECALLEKRNGKNIKYILLTCCDRDDKEPEQSRAGPYRIFDCLYLVRRLIGQI